MELGERLFEGSEAVRSRLEDHDDLVFVGHFAFPSIERAGAGQQGAAGDKAAIEKCADESHSVFIARDGGQDDQGVRMRHLGFTEEAVRRQDGSTPKGIYMTCRFPSALRFGTGWWTYA